jgi:hypothetical protein
MQKGIYMNDEIKTTDNLNQLLDNFINELSLMEDDVNDILLDNAINECLIDDKSSKDELLKIYKLIGL